jgi:SanA protein
VIAVAAAAVLLGVLALLSPLALRAWVGHRTAEQIYTEALDAPSSPAAIVLGAGYLPSGALSSALADRMDTAIALYQAGKVNKLLLTGDNRFADYNEPAAMAAYAEAAGVPREDLVLDYAGRRTYDSCYRAAAIFGAEQAILVTQEFHLPRALYTCNQLGLETVGVVADRRTYYRATWYQLRELFALTRAWLDVNLFKPVPVLGNPIPVDWSTRAGGNPQEGSISRRPLA